jgi:hypothetical protein
MVSTFYHNISIFEVPLLPFINETRTIACYQKIKLKKKSFLNLKKKKKKSNLFELKRSIRGLPRKRKKMWIMFQFHIIQRHKGKPIQ